mmetsp:Transcript_44513/g.95615  ORF Transcript_44513/g.95615 Transcript_44513/m.95615 type:complete len:214 (-) Transcript_44513:201-842(-)
MSSRTLRQVESELIHYRHLLGSEHFVQGRLLSVLWLGEGRSEQSSEQGGQWQVQPRKWQKLTLRPMRRSRMWQSWVCAFPELRSLGIVQAQCVAMPARQRTMMMMMTVQVASGLDQSFLPQRMVVVVVVLAAGATAAPEVAAAVAAAAAAAVRQTVDLEVFDKVALALLVAQKLVSHVVTRSALVSVVHVVDLVDAANLVEAATNVSMAVMIA